MTASLFNADDERKPFLDHLEDLRWTIIKSAAALGLAAAAAFMFSDTLLSVAIYPLARVTGDASPYLRTLEVTGGFSIAMRLALYSGAAVVSPLLLYIVCRFVFPGLTHDEKKLLGPALFFGACLFACGAALAYFFVIPAGLRFFLSFNEHIGIRSEWTIQNYASFVFHMILAFGISFELPVVVVFLSKLGIITHALLRRHRSHAIVAILIFAAVITPTTDPFNMALLALPMCFLYELCVWIARFIEKR